MTSLIILNQLFALRAYSGRDARAPSETVEFSPSGFSLLLSTFQLFQAPA